MYSFSLFISLYVVIFFVCVCVLEVKRYQITILTVHFSSKFWHLHYTLTTPGPLNSGAFMLECLSTNEKKTNHVVLAVPLPYWTEMYMLLAYSHVYSFWQVLSFDIKISELLTFDFEVSPALFDSVVPRGHFHSWTRLFILYSLF